VPAVHSCLKFVIQQALRRRWRAIPIGHGASTAAARYNCPLRPAEVRGQVWRPPAVKHHVRRQGRADVRPAMPDTCPGRTPVKTFWLVRRVHSNPLRSRERRFESCRGHFESTSEVWPLTGANVNRTGGTSVQLSPIRTRCLAVFARDLRESFQVSWAVQPRSVTDFPSASRGTPSARHAARPSRVQT
jgi:hypothetical protein